MKIDKQSTFDFSVNAILSRLQNKGLVSLYLCGSFGTQDELPASDIDLLAVFDDTFDSQEAEQVDEYLRTEVKNQMGVKASLARITRSELEGKTEREQFVPIPMLVKHFPFFRHVWGQTIDPKSLGVQPLPQAEEARLHITQIRRSIRSIRASGGKGKLRPPEFAKMILHLAFVEAEAEYGISFSPSYVKLCQSLAHMKDHIIHQAMAVRKSRDDTVDTFFLLCDLAEKYLQDIEQKLKHW